MSPIGSGRLVLAVSVILALGLSPASLGEAETAAATPPVWDPIYSLAFSPDGRTLASTHRTTIKLWDVATGNARLVLQEHTFLVVSIAISSDGRTLVSGAQLDDGRVLVWNLPAGTLRHALRGHRRGVNTVAISPDGRMVASGGGPTDGDIYLWELERGTLIREIRVNPLSIEALAFSPDGGTLASGAVMEGDEGIRLWDPRTGQLKARVGHTASDFVYKLAYEPRGQFLAGVGGTKSQNRWSRFWARVYDLSTGALMFETEDARSIAFSPDGKMLATGQEKAVVLWDIATWKSTRRLEGHADTVGAVAFSSDGRWLATGGNDLRLWELQTGSLRRILR